MTPDLRYDYDVGGREERKAKTINGMEKKEVINGEDDKWD